MDTVSHNNRGPFGTMKPPCNAFTHGLSKTYHCDASAGHLGSHMDSHYKYTWSAAEKEAPLKVNYHSAVDPAEAPAYPWAYFVGGRAAGKVNSSYHYVAQAAEPAQYEEPDQEETPVLLTLEDLKVIAYYLPSDGNDDDAPTVAKIEEALKEML